MERGLLWLPLLIVFIWLAWSGWNEYQKLEAYRRWAEGFERAKYDIYSVLGQKEKLITWGKPTRSGPIDLQTFSLEDVQEVRLLVDDKAFTLEPLPNKGSAVLEFIFFNQLPSIKVPFTEILLAAQWANYLQNSLN